MKNSSNSSEFPGRNTNLNLEWNQPKNFLHYPTELISNYNAKVEGKAISFKPKRIQKCFDYEIFW